MSTTVTESVPKEKRIGAPAERVYDAFVDPDLLVRWLSPKRFHGVSAEVDARVGGKARLNLADDDGEPCDLAWEYIEMVPNRRLVMSWSFDGPGADPTGHRSRLTIELEATGPDSTELTLTHDLLREAPPGGRVGVDQGWTESLEKLAAIFRGKRTEEAG